jgi:DDE superfamily endonuclease
MEDIDLRYFLITINWLKLYDTEHVLAGRWKLDESTIRNHVKKHLDAIQSLKETKVVWGGFEDEEIFIISVDGVHCRIQEVHTHPGAEWYSHKSNSAGVTYELGIAIRSNRLVWLSGPFPASQHDVTTFRSVEDPDASLKSKIPDGKRAIGDSGYKGEPSKIAITHQGDSAAVKCFKARVKSRHETFNARLKSFNVLDTAFRHGFDQHKRAFESVCICVQYDIENGHGLFEV